MASYSASGSSKSGDSRSVESKSSSSSSGSSDVESSVPVKNQEFGSKKHDGDTVTVSASLPAGKEENGGKKKKKLSGALLIVAIVVPVVVAVLLIVILPSVLLSVKKDVLSNPDIGATHPLNGKTIPYAEGAFAKHTPTFTIEEAGDFKQDKCKVKSRYYMGEKAGKWKAGVNPTKEALPLGSYVFEFMYQCGNKASRITKMDVQIDPSILDISIVGTSYTNTETVTALGGDAQDPLSGVALIYSGEEFNMLSGMTQPGWLHKYSTTPTPSFVLLHAGEYTIRTTNKNNSVNTLVFSTTKVKATATDDILTAPDSVVIVTDELIEGTTATQFAIGAKVEFVKPGAFGNTELSTLTVHPDNTHFTMNGGLLLASGGEVIAAPPKMAGSVIIPSTSTQIGEFAFLNCGQLTSITLHKDITSIGEAAFWGCNSNVALSITGIDAEVLLKVNDTIISEGSFIGPVHFIGEEEQATAEVVITLGDSPIKSTLVGRTESCLNKAAQCDTKKVFSTCVDGDTSVEAWLYFVEGGFRTPILNDSITASFDCAAPAWDGEAVTDGLKEEDISLSFTDAKSNITSVEFTFGSEVAKAVLNGATTIDTPNGKFICTFTGKTVMCTVNIKKGGMLSVVPEDALGSTSTYEVEIIDWACGSADIVGGAAVIPTNILKLSSGLLDGCASATSVTLHSGITNISSDVFNNMVNLTSFTLVDQAGVSPYIVLNGILYGGSGFATLFHYPCKKSDAPEVALSATKIGDNAFNGCTNITSVTLHDLITSIGLTPFKNSGITSLAIKDFAVSYTLDGADVSSPQSISHYEKDFVAGDVKHPVSATSPNNQFDDDTKAKLKFIVDGSAAEGTAGDITVRREGGSTERKVGFEYSEGETKIPIANQLVVNVAVDTTTILIESLYAPNMWADLMYTVGDRSFTITASGSTTAVDLKSDTTLATYDSANNKIKFSVLGDYKLTITISDSEKAEQNISVKDTIYEVPSTITTLKRADLNLSYIKTLIIPSTVTYVDLDALLDMSSLEVIIVDTASTSDPESCTFNHGIAAGDTTYFHIPVLRTDLSAPTKIITPAYDFFMATRDVPVVQFAAAVDESITIGDATFTSGRAGYNYYSVKPAVGTLTITCGGETKDLTVIEWNETTAKFWPTEMGTEGKLRVPYGVYKIGGSQYNSDTTLKSITLPPTLKIIPANGFRNASGVTAFTIAGGVKSIGSNAFESTRPPTVVIPGSVETIATLAFSYINSGAPTITLNEGLKTIEEGAFVGAGFKKYNIPASVTTITGNPFTYSSVSFTITSANERFVMLDENVLVDEDTGTLITFISRNPTSQATYQVPTTITKLGYKAFSEGSAEIPGKGITTVTLHEGVTEIGGSCFYYCKKLTTLNFGKAAPTLGEGIFQNTTIMKEISFTQAMWKEDKINRYALSESTINKIIFQFEAGGEEACTAFISGKAKFYGSAIVTSSCELASA